MAVSIVLNQTGKSAGVAGQAREDLDLGTPIIASAAGGPFTAYRWTIISKAYDLLTVVKSAVGLSSPTTSTTQVSPIDVEGTYLLELAVDSGYGLGALDTDIARITFYAGTPLAANPRLFPRREPAFGERREHNAPDALDPTGNPDGWAREKMRQFLVLRDLWNGRLWAGGTVVGNTSPSFQRQYGMDPGGVFWNGTSYEMTFQTPLPDAAYSVLVTPQGAAGANGFVVPRVDSLGTSGFVVSFCDDLSTGNLVDADFSFRVELAVILP